MRHVGAILAMVLAIAAAPAAAGEPPGPVTIAFQASGTVRDQYSASTSGTFNMTGRFSDAGNMRTTYRFAGTHLGASAMIMGARGIFTISMRGTLGPIVEGHQSASGRWRLCGGTGAYRSARAGGMWESAADVRAAPVGMTMPAMRGTYYGRFARGPAVKHAGSLGVSCTPGVT